MKAKKINLYLNPENRSHAKVLNYLESAGASTTEAVVVAVLAYLQENRRDDKLIEAVKSTITECLSQQVPLNTAPIEVESSPADDNNQAVSDFLAFFKT